MAYIQRVISTILKSRVTIKNWISILETEFKILYLLMSNPGRVFRRIVILAGSGILAVFPVIHILESKTKYIHIPFLGVK